MSRAGTVELKQPDIDRYQHGNTGIDYVQGFDSGKPGPHLWINAITHGDETCGAIAVDHLLRLGVRPAIGRLTLSFANIAAFRNVSSDTPLGTRYYDEDLNRVWDRLDGSDDSYELRRARELRPVAEAADYLLDLHAMHHPSEPPVIVGTVDDVANRDRGLKLARELEFPTLYVADKGHKAGRRLRDFGAFADPERHNTALVLECGGWWQRTSSDVALNLAIRFLEHFGALVPGVLDKPDLPLVSRQRRLVEILETVTIESTDFRFTRPISGDEIIPQAGSLIAMDGERAVRTPFDDCFLMFPTRAPKPGDTAIRLGRMHEIRDAAGEPSYC